MKITKIEDYIHTIKKIIEAHPDKTIVFRGEPKDYGDTACIPNIFRNGLLEKNPFFEKNILDEMTSNKIAVGNSYLEKAINAQHDGFPSRLLDVSYNCLVALHFAVTPHYKKDEDVKDDEDGKVFVYFFDEIFCPTGDGISNNYEAIINRNEDWYNDNKLFDENFKLIDHMTLNERIKAQKGAFILFKNNLPIPKEYFEPIDIDHASKKEIRNDLKLLFGIDNSTMYPESPNLVNNITLKSKIANNVIFSALTECNLAFPIMSKHLDQFIKDKIMKERNIKTIDLIIRELERKILDYKNEVELIMNSSRIDIKSKSIICETFNNIILQKYDFLKIYKSSTFEFANEMTLIKKVEEKNNDTK